MEGEVKICRLCFTTIDNGNFEKLDGMPTQMIKVLSISLKLFISKDPVICNHCSQNLQKFFDFKTICLNAEKHVNSFKNGQEPAKIDLRDVLLMEMSENDIKGIENRQICRLCLNFKEDTYTKLTNAQDAILNEMLTNCIPELNLNLTEDPAVCCNCLGLLKDHFVFIKSCLKIEEKIKNYCIIEMHDSESKIDLKKVSLRIAEVKQEVDVYEQPAVEFVACQSSNDDIKSEVVENENTSLGLPTAESKIILFNGTQSSDAKTFACKECDYQAQSKRDLKIHCFSHGKGKRLYECPLCNFITQHRTVIVNHQLTHKSLDEIDWHQCEVCTYRTKLKANLRNHMQTHKKPEEVKRFKCEECPYRTLWKRDLERHVLKHKEPEEITMYKCEYCGFTTKHERYLKQHVAKLHLGGTEPQETSYSCANCNFTTKLKRSLVPHMLIHRNPEDLKIYRCSVCPYQAKWKESVKKHELIHKNKFKCDECDFETTLKRFLTKHKLAHRSLEDAPEVYACELCPFQTLRKNSLQNHMLVHKTADEVTMHSCPHCEYKTKRLQDLKQHVLVIHTEDITVYACEHCPYRTKYKYNFRQHGRLMHRGPGDVELHRCELCDFVTKYRRSLLSHAVSYHKSADEITMIKCPLCDFETKRRECLRMHLVTHKRPDELEMFECGDCGFRTKYKRALKKHMTGHRPGAKQATAFRCDWCGFETRWKQTITKHKRRHEEVSKVDGDAVADGWTTVFQDIKTIKEEVLTQ